MLSHKHVPTFLMFLLISADFSVTLMLFVAQLLIFGKHN